MWNAVLTIEDGCVVVRIPVTDLKVRKVTYMPPTKFSTRERQVFLAMAAGKQNKEIAQALNISLRTAKFHCSNVMRKLGVDSRYKVNESQTRVA